MHGNMWHKWHNFIINQQVLLISHYSKCIMITALINGPALVFRRANTYHCNKHVSLEKSIQEIIFGENVGLII